MGVIGVIMESGQSLCNHDSLMQAVVNVLKKAEFTDIRANFTDFKNPDVVGKEVNGKGFIPDITARKGIEFLMEIETEDSIGDRYTDVKWVAFDTHAREKNKMFYIIVPQGLSSRVYEIAGQLKIFPKVTVV